MLGDQQGTVFLEHRYPLGDRLRFVASTAVLRLLFTCVHSSWQKSMKIACGDGIFARKPNYRTVSAASAQIYPNTNILSALEDRH